MKVYLENYARAKTDLITDKFVCVRLIYGIISYKLGRTYDVCRSAHRAKYLHDKVAGRLFELYKIIYVQEARFNALAYTYIVFGRLNYRCKFNALCLFRYKKNKYKDCLLLVLLFNQLISAYINFISHVEEKN